MSTLTNDEWVQYRQAKPQAMVRLFCFPYAGGGASLFRNWVQKFPPEIEVCPVQLPGRENRLRQEAYTNIHLLLEPLARALQPYFDMPYSFFGHSMGALISFEITRYLRRDKHTLQPVHLFVSGRRAPQIPNTDAPLHQLPEDRFIEALRDLKGTSESILQTTELLQILLPLLYTDFALCETYKYISEKLLTCPITAFGGLQDKDVPRDTAAAWKEQTQGPFRLRFFIGDHFFLHQEQNSLQQVICQDLFLSLRATQHDIPRR
jgi:medium-chain acyl-[acyl-carrier-protein] hydrolase